MLKSNIKIIFFGTSNFAVPALEALTKEGYDIVAVVTNPDEPIGRKKVLSPPPVKVAAEKLHLRIFQPRKLETGNWKLEIPDADIGVIAAYGKIIPPEIISSFPYGILNIHPSLLPKYRGPTPIQTTILNGEKETGATIIKIDEEIDHGPTIASEKLKTQSKKFIDLQEKLAELGANLLIKILPDYMADKIELQLQDHLQATFTKKFTRDDARINWNKTAEEIDRQIRALNPEPGTWTVWNGKVLKIMETKMGIFVASGHDRGQMQPIGPVGQVFLENGEIAIRTASGSIVLKTVQLEGKKPMSAENFVRGNRDFIGAVFE